MIFKRKYKIYLEGRFDTFPASVNFYRLYGLRWVFNFGRTQHSWDVYSLPKALFLCLLIKLSKTPYKPIIKRQND